MIKEKHLDILLKETQKFLSKFNKPDATIFFKKKVHCDQLELILMSAYLTLKDHEIDCTND